MSERKSCLIVDDSKIIRMVATKILRDLGLDVVEATNGKEALERCREARPDVILLDWYMPEMSGIEFLKAFKALPDNDRTYVVFCSSENDINHIQEAIDAGAAEYIMKPFDSTIIRSKFEQVGLLDP